MSLSTDYQFVEVPLKHTPQSAHVHSEKIYIHLDFTSLFVGVLSVLGELSSPCVGFLTALSLSSASSVETRSGDGRERTHIF